MRVVYKCKYRAGELEGAYRLARERTGRVNGPSTELTSASSLPSDRLVPPQMAPSPSFLDAAVAAVSPRRRPILFIVVVLVIGWVLL